jgi:TatD DNase family protein
MKNVEFIDFHTHKALCAEEPEIVEVISNHKEVKNENEFFTIGHHPWWTNEILTGSELTTLKLNLTHSNCLGIGECGLDKLKGAPKEIQEEVFYQHIQIANEINAPLIVHCVRQYDQVLNFRKNYGNTPWVIHGFRRNYQLAKSLLDQGIKVSISPIIHMNTGFIEMIEYLPLDGFFIETDSEYSMTIKERYVNVAELKKMDIFALQNQMKQNFIKFYQWKESNLIG